MCSPLPVCVFVVFVGLFLFMGSFYGVSCCYCVCVQYEKREREKERERERERERKRESICIWTASMG
jgi:hypothetical protein